MGGLPGLVGLGGGAGGTSFNVQNPLQPGQLQGAAAGVGNSLQQQQQLLQALQAQQGLANQSQVYGQLQNIAAGGVNPAQAQFAQNTAQNVANQAALMAGQRGASANVGLLARQAAQQGAGIQQQAVGQEAAQQAQNQIAAIQGAGNLATTQAGQQIGATQAISQAQLANQGQLLGAAGQYNAAQAGLANTQLQGQQGLIGGVLGGLGIGASSAAGAEGGEIVKMADGGGIGWTDAPVGGGQGMMNFGQNQGASALQSGASSAFGKFLHSKTTAAPAQNQGTSAMDAAASAPVTNPVGGQATSPAAMGITSTFGPPQAGGGMIHDYRVGGKVNAASPKEKAVKKGNDYANDKIPAVLSEHEIVLPRSVTLSKDPVRDAAKFVQSVIAKRKGRK